jgi:hypothetical protein
MLRAFELGRGNLMIRAILASGGVVLILSPFVAFLLWQGGNSPSRMTSNDAVTIGFVALIGGVLCLYFSRRFPPASSWLLTIVGWIVGVFAFPMLMDVVAVLLLAVLR